MALRPKPREVTGDVPLELLNKAHSVWLTEKATRKWLELHSLEWHHRMDSGPLNRHARTTIAWAQAEGWTRTMPGGYEMPDWRRLREAGVPNSGGDELVEFMRHAGVEWD